MRMKDLTNSELMFVYRRRHGMTQAAAAEMLGETVAQYRAWETGEEIPTTTQVRVLSKGAGGGLTIGEMATVMRRREGMTQPELAEALEISVNWLCKMEKGEVRANEDLCEYWGLQAA